MRSNPHKGDDTRIQAYYVGRSLHGAYFFDPISGNIIYSSSSHYKIVDDLQTKRLLAPTALQKYRVAPQLFSKPSFTIPAKTNALSSGLITQHDISPEETRTLTAKRTRASQKATKSVTQQKATAEAPAKRAKQILSLKHLLVKRKIATNFNRAGPKSDPYKRKGTHEVVGWNINVAFDDGIYHGTIESYDSKNNLYSIAYDDGDIEQLFPSEVLKCVVSPPSQINKLNKDALKSQRGVINFLRETKQVRSKHIRGTVNFIKLDTLKQRAVQSVKSLKSARSRSLRRNVKHTLQRLNKAMRKAILGSNYRERNVRFSEKITSMPFGSAHPTNNDEPSLLDCPHEPDSDSNVTELVNALRDTTNDNAKVELDFDIRHTSAANDPEFSNMEHTLTLGLTEHDGHLVINKMQGYDMSDTPKLRNVLDPNHPLHAVWCKGILTELIGLQVNKILQPISLDNLTSEERRHLLPSQIILKMKRSPGEDRKPIRAKARWVVGGHRAVSKDQAESDYYHYDEVSAKGCNASTLRLLAVIATKVRKLLHATDIKQAFTTAPLDQNNPNRVFIRLPNALETRDSRGVPIVALLKNVYGMPNAGYLFATALDNHLVDIGFEPSRGDHNLHRRFNKNNEIQLYASYVDDGTALFPHNAEYEKFLKELQSKQRNGQTFELGLAQVQEETLGCKVLQAQHKPGIGEPGELGHVDPTYVEVDEGENYTTLIQPGLTREILEIAQLYNEQERVKPTQVPMCPKLAKLLDETIPLQTAHAALLKKKIAARQARQRHDDIHDQLDPFEPSDDVTPNPTHTYSQLDEKEKFHYEQLQPIFGVHYRTLVGKLLYLSRFTRPDIATSVSILSRYVSSPGYHAMAALKYLCRYLKGTPRHGIRYTEPPSGTKLEVRFYADSNYPVGRARLGYVALIGYTDSHGIFHGRALDWHSRLSSTTSTSTAEAELYAAYHAFTRTLTLKKDLDHAQVTNPEDPCRCFEDNKAVFHQFNAPLLRTSLTWIGNKYFYAPSSSSHLAI